MRKIGVLFLFVILFCNFVLAATSLDSVEEKVNSAEEAIDQYGDSSYWGEKWDYPGQEWKEILLKRPLIKKMDELFTKFSIVFRILFGMDYSLSFVLFVVILLWLFIFLDGGTLIKTQMPNTTFLPYVLSGLFAIVLSQLNVLENIVLVVLKILVLPEHYWTRTILMFLFFGVLFFMHFAFRRLTNYLRERAKVTKERLADKAKTRIIQFFDRFRENSRSV